MATGISFSGLSSGLDTDSIVAALTQAESARKTTLQQKQNTLKLRQAAYTTIKTGLAAVSRAAGTLNSASAFSTIKATSGDDAVATISASSSAIAGAFDLDVEQLAKANKVGSAAQPDTTSALGKSGTASVNGKAFSIEVNDSLTSLAKKVNALGAGVTASIVDGGAGRGYLTFSSTSTGSASAVSLADLGGTALKDLGLVGTGATIRQASGSAAVGNAFSTKTGSIQSVLGATGLASSTITIDGTTINVDPATDTLDDLAGRINGAGIPGVSASVQADTKDGATVYRLQISGNGAPPAISETGGVLRGLGILRSAAANELVAGQDAKFTLDGVELVSATNTVTSAIAGATLTLKKAEATSLTLTKDTAAVKKNVDGLVSSVNDLLATIKSQSTFDTKTFQSGVLFGDTVARNAKESVRSLLFTDSPGVTGSLKNLASIGMGIDETGSVTLDEATFQAALERDPEGVAALFQAVGKGSSNDVKYVSATSTAAASPTGGYAINVTQVPTRASLVAGTAQTGARSTAETLTFKGGAFGSSGIAIDFEAGTDLNATVAKINADGRLKDLVTASIEGGKLRIDAKKYGTGGNFTLVSNFSSSGSNSGIGVGGEGTAVAAVDLMGTIGGEPATGTGQFLIGATGNAKTEGLQIQYAGTATGDVGTVNYSRGAASRMMEVISGFNDTLKGAISAADKGLQTQIEGLDKDMAAVDARIESKTTQLKKRFAAMEDALAKLKNQSNSLASLMNTNSSSGG